MIASLAACGKKEDTPSGGNTEPTKAAETTKAAEVTKEAETTTTLEVTKEADFSPYEKLMSWIDQTGDIEGEMQFEKVSDETY